MKTIENALIESTSLGKEGHGIMTCDLGLCFGSWHQGFGGYAFDEFHKGKECRVGTAYGLNFIMNVLEVAGVDRWEDLVGKVVRVESDDGKILRIGHVIKNIWLSPQVLAEAWKDSLVI